jgi:hypothetical protein
MKLLKCALCEGEVDIIGNEHSITPKTKCRKCGLGPTEEVKGPEIIIMRKRHIEE